MAIAKVFKHGNSQAVRLPKEFRVEGDEVEVSRVGRVIVLSPKRTRYEDIVAAFGGFRGTIKRHQDADQDRDWSHLPKPHGREFLGQSIHAPSLQLGLPAEP